jgi:NTE family protein
MKKFACTFWLTSAPLTLGMALSFLPARAQNAPPPASQQQPAQNPVPSTPVPGQPPQTPSHTQPAVPPAQGSTPIGHDQKSDSKPASEGENAASTQRLRLGALDPSTPPTDLPKNRPVIGLAIGGGGAVAMSEIGMLQWFEEHRIPVDVVAGTSMGSILAALYSTGKTPEQMQHIMTEESVTNVFRIQSEYSSRDFRRREDSREVPNAIGIGLKHGAGFRNALFTDTGLN